MNASLEELAALYVLDRLDARERAAFETRLLREPALAALVRELEATVALGIRALPLHEPPAGLLAHIEQRIDASTTAARARPAARARARSPLSALRFPAGFSGILRWGLAAVIALSLATLAVQSFRRPAASPVIVFVGLDAQRSTFTELPLQKNAGDADARFMQLASLAEQFWEKPDHLPIKPVAGDQSRGYALFDPRSQQGFIAIEQLPAIAADQHYHLWIADSASGRVRDAGILPVAASHRGLYSFSLAATGAPKAGPLNVFVTVEDDGAPKSQPRGQVVLGDRRI